MTVNRADENPAQKISLNIEFCLYVSRAIGKKKKDRDKEMINAEPLNFTHFFQSPALPPGKNDETGGVGTGT